MSILLVLVALVALVFVGGAVIAVYFVMRGDSSGDRERLVQASSVRLAEHATDVAFFFRFEQQDATDAKALVERFHVQLSPSETRDAALELTRLVPSATHAYLGTLRLAAREGLQPRDARRHRRLPGPHARVARHRAGRPPAHRAGRDAAPGERAPRTTSCWADTCRSPRTAPTPTRPVWWPWTRARCRGTAPVPTVESPCPCSPRAVTLAVRAR
jgi:hypothetical protein